MSWSKLAPIVKSSGRPMVSAAIAVNKDGAAKISLVLSASIHDDYQSRVRCDVSAGEGKHQGCLLVEFAETGAFQVKPFGKGGGRVFVPVPDGLPQKPAANTPCTLGERTSDSMVVRLPVAEWARAIEARQPAAAAAKATTAAAAPVGNGKPLDMVEYLRGKGVRIDRLAGSRFQVDGSILLTGAVLKLVNQHREAADLDPLPASKVW